MKTAIVSLATHDYLYGAETLFFTLKKHNDLNGIDLYCITDPAGPPSVLLSRLGVKPVTYSGNLEGIQTSESVPHFKETTKKAAVLVKRLKDNIDKDPVIPSHIVRGWVNE